LTACFARTIALSSAVTGAERSFQAPPSIDRRGSLEEGVAVKRLVCALVVVSVLRAAAADTPRATVERLHEVLLDVLKQADALGYRGRFERLTAPMADAFDLDFMAERSLGGEWQKLSEPERTRWRELFGQFTIANYAANFDHWSQQRFEILGEEAGTSDTTAVRTRVRSSDQGDVDLTYRLRRTNVGWKIVDVYLKGTVSELALRRADFAAVLDREGFAKLESTVRARLDDLAAGRGKRPLR
jgi:phospholipid transport system substrate-binding protein